MYLLHSDFPSLTGSLEYIISIVITYHMIWQYESTHPRWKFTDEHMEQIRVYVCLFSDSQSRQNWSSNKYSVLIARDVHSWGTLCSHSSPFWDIFITAMSLSQPLDSDVLPYQPWRSSLRMIQGFSHTPSSRDSHFREMSRQILLRVPAVCVFLVTVQIFSCPNLSLKSHDGTC